MSNDAPNYRVAFSPDAWAIDYVDNLGKFIFVFECDIDDVRKNGATKKLLLYGGPPIQGSKVIEYRSQADREHGQLMLNRTTEYLRSLGYEVKVV